MIFNIFQHRSNLHNLYSIKQSFFIDTQRRTGNLSSTNGLFMQDTHKAL
uniref:Uncharacterized protein n=1 Tax=Arundo donax TaxID=35708 RepID=A0A0A8Z6G5_ARUDO